MAARKIPRRFRTGTRGTARVIEKRQVSASQSGHGSEDYMAFRLEIVDDEGDVKDYMPVEIRAAIVSGRVLEGDTVIVLGHRNRRGILIAKRIYNEKTSSEIKIMSQGFGDAVLRVILGLLWMCAGLGLFGGILLTVSRENVGPPLLAVSIIMMIICIYIGKKRRW